MLRWSPVVSLEEWLNHTIDYFRKFADTGSSPGMEDLRRI